MQGNRSLIAALAGAALVACGGAEPASLPTDATQTDVTSGGTAYVYRDALVSPWVDWSWASRTLANPSPVAAGTASIRVNFGAWQGLYFHRSTAVATSGYSAVVLSVNGGTGSGQVLQVRGVLGNGTATTGVALGPTCAGGKILAGQWVTCRIPITSIAPAGSSLTGIAVQEWSGKTLAAMYLDEIGLEPVQQAVTVAVSPSTASIQTGQTAQLSASVSGSTNTAVTWSVQEGAAGGSVSAAGLYTAPSTAGTYHVVATSQADPTRSASAAVTVTAPVVVAVAVAVSPQTATLAAGGTQAFSAQVTGTANTAVTWSVQEGAAGGTVSSAGLYTAPAAAGTWHVVATSQADPTKSAAATVSVAAAAPPPSTGKESWVWIYVDYANQLTAIANNKASFTHVSPTFYTVNYGYQSGVAYYSNCPNISNCSGNGANNFSGLTTKQFTDRVKAMGLATVPLIYGGAGNAGTDLGIQNILNNTNGAGDSFIAAMTAEAVSNGYDGYNLDWETGSGVNATYVDKFVAFVNKFKAALAPYGMSLSVDAIVSNIHGTWCSGNNGYMDFPKLSASAVDRIIIEDYTGRYGTATASCQNVVLNASSPALCDFTFTGMLNMMCSPNVALDKAVIGVEADPYATNAIAGAAFSALQSYGFTRVAVWPQYPFMNASGIQPANDTWYGLLQYFLAH